MYAKNIREAGLEPATFGYPDKNVVEVQHATIASHAISINETDSVVFF